MPEQYNANEQIPPPIIIDMDTFKCVCALREFAINVEVRNLSTSKDLCHSEKRCAKLPDVDHVLLTLDELHVATEGPLGLVALGGLLGGLLLGCFLGGSSHLYFLLCFRK